MTGPNPKIPAETIALREEIVEIYKRAQDRLKRQLMSTKLTDFRRFRIAEQLAQVNKIVAALNADLKDTLPNLIPAYYEYGVDLADVALKAQEVDIISLNMGNRIHTAGVQVVAQQMALDLAGANQSMKQISTQILRETQQTLLQEKQVNRIIADGIVNGETRRETSARLQSDLEARLNGARFVKAGNKTFTPEYYAELVTRTRTREAVTQGAISRTLEHGVTLAQISFHSSACDVCKRYEGKVFSLVKDDGSGFPFLDRRPPFHPNCRHVLVGYVLIPGREDEIEALKLLSNSKSPIQEQDRTYEEALDAAKRLGVHRLKVA